MDGPAPGAEPEEAPLPTPTEIHDTLYSIAVAALQDPLEANQVLNHFLGMALKAGYSKSAVQKQYKLISLGVADMARREKAKREANGGTPDYVANADGFPIWCAENAGLVLETHPDWVGLLAWDEFNRQTLLLRPMPGSHARKTSWCTREVSDEDITVAHRWFNRNGWPHATKNVVADVIFQVARNNVISPVRDYLEGLTWDNRPRIEAWLVTYCGANDTPFVREIGRRWLISAIARALRPGCKADCALILEGGQGVLKSTALRVLASDAWFHDGLADMHSKDAAAGLRGKWIIEIAELAAMRKSELETVKTFISRQAERFRPAYARSEVTEPRRCVFAGTTNADTYLKDPTGNRRFWPAAVGSIDIPALAADRDQLWAEAAAMFRAGERWWLDDAMEAVAAEETREREEEDPWAGEIDEKLLDLSEVSTREVLVRLGIFPADMTAGLAKRVATVLLRQGWKRAGKFTTSGPNHRLSKYVR